MSQIPESESQIFEFDPYKKRDDNPAVEDLYSALTTFPDQRHMQNVCKRGQGASTCRYLTFIGVFSCDKASSLREYLDQRVAEGTIGARGDNCEGVLGKLAEKVDLITGRQIRYREHPNVELIGTVEGLNLSDGYFSIEAKWDSGEVFNPVYNPKYLSVEVTPSEVKFNIPGAGLLAGETSISLVK